MEIIKTITDKEILGADGLSKAAPRYTARAILKNEAGLYAVMYAKKFNLYSLPGGGLEGEEDPLDALRREVLEETGCTCDEVEELGMIYENRFHADYTQYSYYYLVTTHCCAGIPALTEMEQTNGTSVHWYPLEKVISLIESPSHDNVLRKYLQARDVAVLNHYISLVT